MLINEAASQLQTIIFDKNNFTVAGAKAWAKEKGYKISNIDDKEDTIRMRQAEPKKDHGYFTKSIKDGKIKLVFMYKKKKAVKESTDMIVKLNEGTLDSLEDKLSKAYAKKADNIKKKVMNDDVNKEISDLEDKIQVERDKEAKKTESVKYVLKEEYTMDYDNISIDEEQYNNNLMTQAKKAYKVMYGRFPDMKNKEEKDIVLGFFDQYNGTMRTPEEQDEDGAEIFKAQEKYQLVKEESIYRKEITQRSDHNNIVGQVAYSLTELSNNKKYYNNLKDKIQEVMTNLNNLRDVYGLNKYAVKDIKDHLVVVSAISATAKKLEEMINSKTNFNKKATAGMEEEVMKYLNNILTAFYKDDFKIFAKYDDQTGIKKTNRTVEQIESISYKKEGVGDVVRNNKVIEFISPLIANAMITKNMSEEEKNDKIDMVIEDILDKISQVVKGAMAEEVKERYLKVVLHDPELKPYYGCKDVIKVKTFLYSKLKA